MRIISSFIVTVVGVLSSARERVWSFLQRDFLALILHYIWGEVTSSGLVAFFSLEKAKRRPYCWPQFSYGGLRGRLLWDMCSWDERLQEHGYWEMCFCHEGGQTLWHVHRAPVPKAHPRSCSEVVGRDPKHPDLVGMAWNKGWIEKCDNIPRSFAACINTSMPKDMANFHKAALCHPACECDLVFVGIWSVL